MKILVDEMPKEWQDCLLAKTIDGVTICMLDDRYCNLTIDCLCPYLKEVTQYGNDT